MKSVFPGETLDATDYPLTTGHGWTYLRANRFLEPIRLMTGP
ncbi:hypothetical protein [Plantactinospora sp. ZYX-F-223]